VEVMVDWVTGVPSEAAVWVARAVMGVTFLISGAAKLRSGPAFTHAVADYRILPPPLVQPVAFALPAAELALAAALLSGWHVREAAFASILLLLVFAVAVAVNLRRDRRIPCFCFGASGDDTIGWSTFARQALLMVMALPQLRLSRPAVGFLPTGIGAGDAASLLGAAAAITVIVASIGVPVAIWSAWRRAVRTRRAKWASYLGAAALVSLGTGVQHETVARSGPIAQWSDGLQWAVLVVLLLLVVGLYGIIADILRRLGEDLGPPIPDEGLDAGVDAPEFVAGEARSGRALRLSDFQGKAVVLVFVSPDCGSCIGLVPQLNRLAGQRKAPPIVVIVGPGQGVDYADRLSREIRVVHDPKRKIQADYEVRWKPTVYLIDAEQKVALHTISNTLPDLEDTVDGIGHRLSSDSILPKDKRSADDE
jgi:uncharacterized membrane protein YphA (DoxX/SURF4 family)/thiol-disulfide isomerase/thioredoxin